MKKTRREWLNELKPEHAKLAIENVLIQKNEAYLDEIDDSIESVSFALAKSFTWRDSPQEAVFWANIHYKLLKKNYHETV